MEACTAITVIRSDYRRLMHLSNMFTKNYLHCSVLQVINDMNQIWIYFKFNSELVSNKLI